MKPISALALLALVGTASAFLPNPDPVEITEW